MRIKVDNTGDEELLRRMVAGDRDSFERLYQHWQPCIYRFALRMSGSEPLAEDVTQDVFLILMRSGDQFSGRGSFSSYIYTIARHATLQRLRRERRFVEFENADPEEGSNLPANLLLHEDPLADLSIAERAEAVRQAVIALPLHYREVVLLCHLHELSYHQAAEVIGCEIGTICSRLYRARAMLAEKLGKLRESEPVKRDELEHPGVEARSTR